MSAPKHWSCTPNVQSWLGAWVGQTYPPTFARGVPEIYANSASFAVEGVMVWSRLAIDWPVCKTRKWDEFAGSVGHQNLKGFQLQGGIAPPPTAHWLPCNYRQALCNDRVCPAPHIFDLASPDWRPCFPVKTEPPSRPPPHTRGSVKGFQLMTCFSSILVRNKHKTVNKFFIKYSSCDLICEVIRSCVYVI